MRERANDPELWQQPDVARDVTTQLSRIDTELERIERLERTLADLEVLDQLALEEGDDSSAAEVAAGLGALPERTVAIEVEPDSREPSERLSAPAQAGLERALELVREEVARVPVLELADEIRELMGPERSELAGAPGTLHALLDELEAVDREGRWGQTFVLRERLRSEIATGQTPEGMSALDWGLWWGLIEELDRLQPLEDRIGVEASADGGRSPGADT